MDAVAWWRMFKILSSDPTVVLQAIQKLQASEVQLQEEVSQRPFKLIDHYQYVIVVTYFDYVLQDRTQLIWSILTYSNFWFSHFSCAQMLQLLAAKRRGDEMLVKLANAEHEVSSLKVYNLLLPLEL